ncbi:MAG TPA: sodium-dependent transporter, partial [Thermoclostridium caenicola]|nr:sodium-dependent transporter [Thermoclostridium caenicola]
LGALFYALFCVSRYGWGWENFIAEANSGEGIKFPQKMRFYLTYILPVLLAIIFILGYIEKFM